MAQRGGFQVYAASAGSGKTHALVREYLLNCLNSDNPEDFSGILATTFTVKASQEMKSRILEALAWMAGVGRVERNALRQEVQTALGFDDQTLQNKAFAVLSALLHHYSSFSVGTLDNFTTRLIKTFAPELGLHPGFDLELDTKQLLREAVDLTLQKVGSDLEITAILRAFQQSLVSDERNWDFRLALKEAADFLLQERHRSQLKAWLAVTGGRWQAMQTALRERIQAREAVLKQLGVRTQAQLADLNLPVECSANAKPDKVLNALTQGDWDALLDSFDGQFFGTKTFKSACQSGTGFLKKDDAKKYPELDHQLGLILGGLQAEAAPVFAAFTADRLLDKHFLRMVALAAVDLSLEEIKERRQVMLLAEFNHIISEQIRNEPAPFIYERMGERYQHFFIDEFQDTSALQWSNLEPLLENALSQGGSAMVVGDGKQAIYRWRNGEVEQFLDLIATASGHRPKAQPWLLQSTMVHLATSYRSAPEIVQFVNAFLQCQVDLFEHPDYQQLMRSGGQSAKKEGPGGVELTLLEEKPAGGHAEWTAHKALELTQQGWAPGHIAVLVRTNGQVKAVAKALREVGLQVVSPESLLLKEQPAIQFLVAALGILAGKEVPEDRLRVLHFGMSAGVIAPLRVPELKKALQLRGSAPFLHFLSTILPGWDTASLRTMGMYEAARYLAELVRVDPNDQLVQAFLSEILNYGETRQGSIRGFLQWWDLRDPKLELPEGLHAVRVMTIHKSKGLEFPVVIYPFAHQLASTPQKPESGWVSAEPLDGIAHFLVPLNAKWARAAGGSFAEEYKRLEEQQRLDLINIAYVAMTRAEQYLVICADFKKPGEWSGLSHSFGNTGRMLGWPTETPGTFRLGALPKAPVVQTDAETIAPFHWGRKPTEGMRVAATYPPDWATAGDSAIGKGEAIHQWMSRLAVGLDRSPASMPAAVVAWQQHPFWRNLQSNALRMLPERSLAGLPERLRPDLLVEHPDGWWVVDYKTGAEKPEHLQQVNAYAEALRLAGQSVKGRALVYLSDSDIRILENW
jgi:ATP-dependent exoDNAse (exonuclease V) beta subunit